MSEETLGTIGSNGALIKTERLVLRTYHAGMVTPDHIRWLNDPEVVKYSEQRHKIHTLESQHSYINNLWSNPGSIIWMITMHPDKTLPGIQIGTITAHCDIKNRVADMGIVIGDKRMWKKGYGLEAWEAVMQWLFKHAMRKVEAGCMKTNWGMFRLCEKAKMELEGMRLEHFLFDGIAVSEVHFARYP